MKFPACLFLVFLLSSCNPPAEKTHLLFNGRDLQGWDTYIGPPSDSLPPIGLNRDPSHVFSVVQQDGAPAIRISGEYFGGISTQQEFENYHLTLEFKWGVIKTQAFEGRKRDSGVLYHATGPHGVDFGAWMRSQEFQVQETDCGDYWGVAGGVFDIPAVKNEKGAYIYDENGARLTFKDSSDVGRRCIKKSGRRKTLRRMEYD